MSFNNLPKVDRSAEKESLSKNALREHFQEQNGFIAREDHPDKGCDFLVEIITDGSATNWRFPVQLKSSDKFTLIKGDKFISYSFELSRLRYLLEHRPYVGMVILYSVPDNVLYYDYAIAIHHRLKDQYSDDSWKNQEKANIHIPVTNILNISSRTEIHKRVIDTFNNFHQLLDAHSSGHYLGILDTSIGKYNSTDPIRDATTLLTEHGMELYYSQNIGLLYQLINTVPVGVITGTPKLSLIAGITFHEMALTVDADYYLQKVISHPQTSLDEKRHAKWVKAANDYQIGSINLDQLNAFVNNTRLETPAEEQEKLLFCDLNLARNKADVLIKMDKAQILELWAQINDLDRRIRAAQLLDLERYYLRLINCQNLSIVVNTLYYLTVKTIKYIEQQSKKITKEENKEAFDFINGMHKKFITDIEDIETKAIHDDSNILLSRTYELLTAYRVTQELIYLEFKLTDQYLGSPEHQQQLLDDITRAETAGRHYHREQYYGAAYNILILMLELSQIANHYTLNIPLDKERINKLTEELQAKLQTGPITLRSSRFINKEQ